MESLPNLNEQLQALMFVLIFVAAHTWLCDCITREE